MSANTWVYGPLLSESCLLSESAKAADCGSETARLLSAHSRPASVPGPGPHSRETGDVTDLLCAASYTTGFNSKGLLVGPQFSPLCFLLETHTPVFGVGLECAVGSEGVGHLKGRERHASQMPSGNLGNSSDSCFPRVMSVCSEWKRDTSLPASLWVLSWRLTPHPPLHPHTRLHIQHTHNTQSHAQSHTCTHPTIHTPHASMQHTHTCTPPVHTHTHHIVEGLLWGKAPGNFWLPGRGQAAQRGNWGAVGRQRGPENSQSRNCQGSA